MLHILPLLFISFIFSEDFILQDLNETSEYYQDHVGPSSFFGEVSMVYFGHYN